MRMVPLFQAPDMAAVLDFYTIVLDFQMAAWDTPDDVVINLVRGDLEPMLTRLPTDQFAG